MSDGAYELHEFAIQFSGDKVLLAVPRGAHESRFSSAFEARIMRCARAGRLQLFLQTRADGDETEGTGEDAKDVFELVFENAETAELILKAEDIFMAVMADGRFIYSTRVLHFDKNFRDYRDNRFRSRC